MRRRSDVVVGSPLVVACVATWNGEPFIKDALASLAAQTHPNLRVLVSDDASTDGTAAICEGFARSDPRFSFARQPERLGWIGNVNALLRAARGDYLFLVSHDDVVEPTYVARLVDALENRPAAVLAYSDMAFVDLNGTPRSRNTWTSTNRGAAQPRLPDASAPWSLVDSLSRGLPRRRRDAHRGAPAPPGGRVLG